MTREGFGLKTKMKKSNITVPIVLAVALILVLSATFALFTETVDGTRRFTLSNFTSDVVVYFDGHTSANNPAQPSGTTGRANYYEVSMTDPDNNRTNYIGDLRVSVKYRGEGVGLLRVRVMEEWYTEKTVSGSTVRTVRPYSVEMPYFIGDNNALLYTGSLSGNKAKWFDNRANDYCFYYATPISHAGENAKTIEFIHGLDTSKIDFGAIDVNSTNVRVIIEADVVQVNRYPQYWNLTKLPWTGANSATENAAS